MRSDTTSGRVRVNAMFPSRENHLEEELSEEQLAAALGISPEHIRHLVIARLAPRAKPSGEWSPKTLEAFLPLWDKAKMRRVTVGCSCRAPIEKLIDAPGFIGQCSECRTTYLVDGLWLATGEIVSYANEA